MGHFAGEETTMFKEMGVFSYLDPSHLQIIPEGDFLFQKGLFRFPEPGR